MKNEKQSLIERYIAETKKLYYKQWRENHKENIKRHNRTFWEKKAKELKENSSKDK